MFYNRFAIGAHRHYEFRVPGAACLLQTGVSAEKMVPLFAINNSAARFDTISGLSSFMQWKCFFGHECNPFWVQGLHEISISATLLFSGNG